MDATKKLTEAILVGESEIAEEAALEILAAGGDLQPVINQLTETMRILGKQFEDNEIFLPEMMISADAMVAAMNVFEPALAAGGGSAPRALILLGAAPGDMHEIGKNIVGTVLKAEGYEVIDLGPNVAADEFVAKARALKAQVIGISALMTTTMQGAGEIVGKLCAEGSRGNYKVIVGGAPTSQAWAEKIGADGWAASAADVANLVNSLLGA